MTLYSVSILFISLCAQYQENVLKHFNPPCMAKHEMGGKVEPLHLPTLVPVGSKQHQDLPPVVIRLLEDSWKAIHQSPFDAEVVCFEVFKHVQVLLTILEILSQQFEGLEVVKLPGSQKAQDECIVRAEEADIRAGDDHVSDLLDVLVQGIRVLVQLQPRFLNGFSAEPRLQMSHF